MKIVSLNAWGGQVWSALRDWVVGCAPDVLCLQEVTRAPVPSPAWLRYVDPYRSLDQRADLFGDISALLPQHQAFFAPATRGVLQDAEGRDVASEHGLGMWVRRDLAVTRISQAFVNGAFRADGWGPEPVPRTMQVMQVVDPATDRVVSVGHVHGLRDPAGKDDTPARVAQATRIAAQFAALWEGNGPAVLAGDFNVLPDSATFDALRAIGLHDLITHHGITDTRTALYAKTLRFADYMLVSADLRDAPFEVPGTPVVSDHRPLILRAF